MITERPFDPSIIVRPNKTEHKEAPDFETRITEVSRLFEGNLQEVVKHLTTIGRTREEGQKWVDQILSISESLTASAGKAIEDFKKSEGTEEDKARFIEMVLQIAVSAVSRSGEIVKKFETAPGTKEEKGAKLYELLLYAQGAMDTLSRMSQESLEKNLKRLRLIMKIIKPFLPK